MAASTTTAWAKGFSENPTGRRLRARSIIEMLDRIGNEKVRAPGVAVGVPPGGTPDDPDGLLMTRRELLARVLWTRAILDADNASTKLIIEYLDGKPGDTESGPDEAPVFHADDMALAEALLREEMRAKETLRHGEGEKGGVSDDHPDVP